MDTLWFPDADVLLAEPAALPEDGLRAAEITGLSINEAFAVVRHAWGKVDTVERERIGRAGELAMVELFSSIPGATVHHVAEQSDGYGYDVSVTNLELSLHIEVKTTTKRGQLRIYLSRNEYEVMLRDPAWMLVGIRLNRNLQPLAVATVRGSWLSEAVPVDRQVSGRWESARIDVPSNALVPGLDSLPTSLSTPLPPILQGQPPWPG